ncbi:15684_t:CDS:1, partial [Acaulospora morrowiae]
EEIKKDGLKVNLWITGHSLGGALATLFYARLLKTNLNGLCDYCTLQDVVTFASPAVGDHHFAAELHSLMNDPRNKSRRLWRVVLKDDIVPKLPYRACEKWMRKYSYSYDVLMNYVQVGNKITIRDKNYLSLGGEETNEDYCKRYNSSIISTSFGKSILVIPTLFYCIENHRSRSYIKALNDCSKGTQEIDVLDEL